MKDEKPTPLSPPLSGGKRAHSSSEIKCAGSTPPLTRGGREGFGRQRERFVPYNKKLTALARENRKNPTAAESKMWNGVLRMRHFADYKFSRQKPIADFIVDFYCSELRLAIEIDGDTHAEAVEYDAARTAALNASAITVVRYTNDEALKNLSGVYDDLMRRVASLNDGLAK